MSALRRSSSRDAWIIAWALAFLLHALAIVGLRHFPVIGPASATRPAQLEPVQLVFSPPSPTPAPSPEAKPHFFSELPPDRKDAAPAKADFLSNVTSRARDAVGGGSSALPRMRGESDAPTVALDPSGGSSHPSNASPVPPPAPPTPALKASAPPAASPGASAAPSATFSSDTKATDQRHDASPMRQAPDNQGALFGYSGRSDIHQPQMDNPDGNAPLSGDVSLNTTQWEYAPWLQRFGRRLMHTWFAPEAYYLGVLKEGGWAVIEIEIAPSGELLRFDLLEQQGHPSLINAATGAVRAMAPYERLPADFPEKTLVLRIRMVYPKIRR